MDVVAVEGLSKHYGRQAALRGIDLRVPAGSITGFLGPNGAGKTTTIRILVGLLQRSGGRAAVFGLDPWSEGPLIRRDVGYLPGEVRFYDHMTGRRYLHFVDGVRRTRAATEIDRLARHFNLDASRKIRHYSRGMKQKLGLIAAMLHRPKLLILDEPTTGLDPLVRQALFDELRAVAEDGRTVLFSSHTIAEVEELCDRVAIVRDGRMIEQDEVAVLRRRALRHVDIWLESPQPMVEFPDGFHVARQSNGRLSGTWVGPVAPLFAWLAQVRVRDATIAQPDLEDLFMAYYQDDEAGPAR